MNRHILLMGLVAGSVMAPLTAAAKESPLVKHMEEFDDAYKGFRRESDPAKGAALARDAQNAILKAVSETPALIRKMPAGTEKDKAVATYRKMLGRLFVTVCEVEEAFLAGDSDKVAELVTAIREAKKAGHERFMEE
jgi:hypothetical protein